MGTDKKGQAESLNPCHFLLGKWEYGERSFLMERHWINPNLITTPTQSFDGTTGSVEYREIVYGSHIHGEYRKQAEPSKGVMNILFQRTTGDSLEMTIAVSDTDRFSGPARLSGGSIFLDGKGIPFFVGDYLQEASIPLAPNPDRKLVTDHAVCDARVVLHPLRPDRWLLVVYHLLQSPRDYPTILKTEVLHFRSEPKDTAADRDESSEPTPQAHEIPCSPLEFTDLEARFAEVKCELGEGRREHEDLSDELEDVKCDHDEAENEIIDLDFASFGWLGPDPPADSSLAPPSFDESKWHKLYTSLLILMEQLHELEEERASCQDDIDDLEHEAEDIEEALDQGYSAWQEREYRKAEATVEKAARPPLPEGQLLGEKALACLSEEARKILETYLRLDGIYATVPDLQTLDCGPLVATMSKVCERILVDFLGPRCRAIYANPGVFSLLNDPKRTVSIPTEDQSFKIDKGSLKKVLDLIKKPGPLQLSGTRNGSIALLLFGRTYKMEGGAGAEINNPLKIHGHEEGRKELRLDLYHLQKLRNGFVHHEFTRWSQAQEVKQRFEGCLRKLVSILFGVSPN
jgi:hypothetical protein